MEYVCSSRIFTHKLCKITHYVTSVKMLSNAILNDFSYVKLSYLTNDLPFWKFLMRILIWSWSSGGETHFLSASVVTIAVLSCNSKTDRTVNCSVLQSSPTCTYSRFLCTIISILTSSFHHFHSQQISQQRSSQVKEYLSSAITWYLQITNTHFQNANFISFVYTIISSHTNFTADTNM
jgi:hypothetical protein